MDRATQPGPRPDLSGRTVADFRVLRRLGGGGMGDVYLAEQVSLKRPVALKILRPELLASDPTAPQRFRAEAQAVARATHPNIVQVYSWGEADGVYYIALEYVEGRNLRDYLDRKGPPGVPLVLSILRQVASALQRAGELGIIHRDVKPENILLTRKGEVKVADFGLARCLGGDKPMHLTQSGVTLGTPVYMSPEQVEGRPLDPRSDLYSLGVTCYHMLAGHPPFRGASAFDVALQHVQRSPEPLAKVRPDLPAALCALVHKLLAKDPARRYANARDLLKDLARLRDGLSLSEPTAVPPPATPAAPPQETATATSSPTERTATLPRRGPWWSVAVAASLVVALALGAGAAWLRRQTAGPPPAGPVFVAEGEAPLSGDRERDLRAEAEKYLAVPTKQPAEIQMGLLRSQELAVFYLEENRLDDAEQFLQRLDKMPRPYHVLGHAGRGIVLALRDLPQESNKLFHDVFDPLKPAAGPPKKAEGNHPLAGGFEAAAKALERAADKKPAPPNPLQGPVWQNGTWRYWLARAIDHNRKNGLDDKDLPEVLRSLRP
jgi:serine/threonine-protein kinase